MKILLLTSSMGSGGAERVASVLSNAWAARGDKVTLMPTFSGRGECFYELSSCVRLFYLADLVSSRSRTLANQLARLHALRRFIVIEQPDVIVSFLPNVNVAVVVATLGLNIPVIICERTDPFVMPTSRYIKFFSWLTYRFADVLLVQTQAVADKYVKSGSKLKRLRVIPNPVFEQFPNIQQPSNVNTLKRLVSVGRLDEGKQFDVLINIFSNLAQRHSDWSLLIFGEGDLRSALQQQIAKLSLNHRIELMGRSTTIHEELVQADIFVLTSRYEGFPNALLEAMAIGLPCVAFDCPSGPREITLDGQMALLVPLYDEQAFEQALECLMVDVDLRKTLGSKARKSVTMRFSLYKILEKWDLLFQELGVKNIENTSYYHKS